MNSNFHAWFDNKVAEAMATDDGKAFAAAGMTAVHTGGGHLGWAFNYGADQWFVLVTDDDGTGLFSTENTVEWIIGTYDVNGDCVHTDNADTVEEAIEIALAICEVNS